MRLRIIALLLCAVFFAYQSGVQAIQHGGNSTKSSNPSALVFVILPIENVSAMYEKFLPLKGYLEKTVGRPIKLKIAQNYQEAIESIGTGEAHLAFLDPSAYCEARHKYKVLPIAQTILNGSLKYKSVIVTRKDSPINKIVETRGGRLALGNKSSSSSYLIPAVMFKEVGIGLENFKSVDFLEHEDRIALSVLARSHDIGGLSERTALKYINDGLKIVKVSEAIPQFSICAYSKLSPDHLGKIRQALLSINKGKTPDLISAMKDLDGFAQVEDRDFDVVRVMIRNLTGKNYLEYGKNSVKVAILPLYSAITLFERFDPLMRYLSRKTGYEFKLVIPKDFEDFFDIVKQGRVDFSYSNPYIYIQLADKGFLKAFVNTVLQESGDIFRGIIITHKDSTVRTLNDLKGKRVMIVSYKSAGGFLAQKLFLYENNIDVSKDLSIIDGKRQEEVILNVYRKNVDAGFVRESALDVLEEEIDLGKIRILAKTPYIANWPFAAAKNTDEKMIDMVRRNLLELKSGEILRAAHLTGFKPASDKDFDTLRKWIHKHDK